MSGHCSERRSVHGARALVASRQPLVALRRLLQWSNKHLAARRPLCRSFKRPVRALLFPPAMTASPAPVFPPPDPALTLFSPMINFEILLRPSPFLASGLLAFCLALCVCLSFCAYHDADCVPLLACAGCCILSSLLACSGCRRERVRVALSLAPHVHLLVCSTKRYIHE
jgi:hypothetical protein